MIYFRVDANSKIATGHLMRTLAIALAARELGVESCYITADHNCDEVLNSYGIESVCLESAWDNLDMEVDKMKRLIADRKIACILVDTYYVTRQYFKCLSKDVKLIYLDDLHAFEYECDSIINYTIGEKPEQYPYFKKDLFLGPAFTPLRKEFCLINKKQENSTIRNVLVTSGGGDNYHFALKFLQSFLEETSLQESSITIVVGSMSQDAKLLEEQYKNNNRVRVIVNANNMSKLMLEADCAVSAGGSTLYELCACKTPTISFSLADNQLPNVCSFNKLELIPYAGDIRNDISATIETILRELNRLNNVDIRIEKSKKMGKIVDGNGAKRIAEILIKKSRE